MNIRKESDAMHVSAPRFDWTYNFGHVLQSVSLVLAVGGGVAWMSGKIENLDSRLRTTEQLMTKNEPIVSAAQRANDVQDTRIENLGAAIVESRRANTEILSQLATIRETVAGISATIKSDARPR